MNEFRIKFIVLFISLMISKSVKAEDVFFDASLLRNNSDELIDISAFMSRNGGQEGVRNVSVYINEIYVGNHDFYFENDANGDLMPSIKRDFLIANNIKIDASDNIEYVDLKKSIPWSQIVLDQGNSRLDLLIPQSYFIKTKFKSSPDLWDDGIPAFFVNYSASGNRVSSSLYDSDSFYTSLRSGVNIHGWRFRNNSNYSMSKSGRGSKNTQFNNLSNYVEHDVRNIGGVFRGGELSTSSDLLDNISFKGVSLFKNKDMIKNELLNYSPVVQGIANSHAEVSIMQNGKLVYKTNVTPGPFTLEDLNLPRYGGDLYVTVREIDGTEHSFIQTYSTLNEMQRVGMSDYTLSFGQSNVGTFYKDEYFAQADYSYGLSNGMTIYTAGLFSDGYQSIGAGSTFSLGQLGAVSGDVTHSSAHNEGKHLKGQSYNVKYSKSATDSGTTITLASYRYSTENFYSFSDFLYERDNEYKKNRIKNRLSLALSQRLGEFGTLNLNGNRYEYWNNNTADSFSLTHSFPWNKINFNTGFSVSNAYSDTSDTKRTNKQVSFSISAPLSAFLNKDPSATQLRYTHINTRGYSANTLSASGRANDKLSYNLSHDWNNSGNSNNSFSLNYSGAVANVNGGYSYSKDYKQYEFGASGSFLAHQYGLTMSSSAINDKGSLAVIHTNGISDIPVKGRQVKTDLFGNAVIDGLNLYARNTITLDADNIPDDVVLPQSEKSIYPTRGAIVLLKYDALSGNQVIFKLMRKNGKPLPFGTTISLVDSEIENTGIVGDDGQVFMAGLPKEGVLEARWGKDSICKIQFKLSQENGISEKSAECY